MSSSFLSVLIQRQAGKYGDRVALRYRDYKTETWIPVSWNQFAATVKTVSNALIEFVNRYPLIEPGRRSCR